MIDNDFIVITYCGGDIKHYNDSENMIPFIKRLNREMKIYTREFIIGTDFYKINKQLLDHPKLNGWAAWKPYIILDALNKFDRVLYMDANTIFRKRYENDISNIVNSVEILSSIKTTFSNKQYTKKECFDIMECNDDKYINANQVWAGIVIATNKSKEILNEWLKFCCNEKAICSDKLDIHHHNHRHDQSILTNLMIKYNLPAIDTIAFMDNANARNHPLTGEQI